MALDTEGRQRERERERDFVTLSDRSEFGLCENQNYEDP